PSKLQGGLMSENFTEPSGCLEMPGLGQAARFREPPVQLFDSFPNADFGRPSGGGFELARVGDVIPLIAGAPGLRTNGGSLAVDRPDHLDQLFQAERIAEAAADIESLAGERVNVGLSEQEGVDQV